MAEDSSAQLDFLIDDVGDAHVTLPDDHTAPVDDYHPVDALHPQDDLVNPDLLLDTASQTNPRLELVVIDSSVPDYQALVDDLLENKVGTRIEILILDDSSDGIGQITSQIAALSGVDAIHIVSHGSDGAVRLGDTWVSASNLKAYAGQIASWGQSLDADADLVFYGCDLAASDQGQEFLTSLGALCDCDVAASDDATGHASLGGDWELEYATGTVETEIAFSTDVQSDWLGLLNTYTVTNTNDSGAGSLRQAILDANANGGADTIDFNIAASDMGHYYYVDDGIAGQVSLGNITTTTAATDTVLVNPDVDFAKSWYSIQLTTSLPTIVDVVTIDASSQSGFSGTPIIELNAGSMTGENVFTLEAGSSEVRGFVINRANIGEDAIEIEFGGGNTIAGNYIGTDVSGSIARGNDWGLNVKSDNNTIGGTTAADRNVISGNLNAGLYIYTSSATNNVVSGNYIGLDATGSDVLGNGGRGVWIWDNAADNHIGGTAAGAGNVISGNSDDGIFLQQTTGNVIQGNFIGTDATGMVDLGNSDRGVQLESGSHNNTIGGTTLAAQRHLR